MTSIHSDGIHSNGRRGLTVIELMIGLLLGIVVVLGAGSMYVGVMKTFRIGTQKLVAQREASLLSTVISRRVRVGSSYEVYVVPNRTVLADSGNGLAIRNASNALLTRLEWNSTLRTLVDSTGNRVTSMELANLQFKRDPVQAHTVRYRFQTDDLKGNLVDIQSGATLRN